MIRVENKRCYQGYGVYVGRPSLLGNPYVIGKDGDRDEVIRKYRVWLWRRIEERGDVYHYLCQLKETAEQDDLVLLCWCAPMPCHADQVKRAIEYLTGIENRPMKVIVAGSRTITDPQVIAAAINHSGFRITEVVSGCARGVDQLGEAWARSQHIPVKQFPANWDQHGKRAGYLRNEQMSRYADALVAIWDGISSGTKHMIDSARERGLKVYVHLMPARSASG